MKVTFSLSIFLLIIMTSMVSCSSGNSTPVVPGPSLPDQTQTVQGVNGSQTHLWGYYDCTIDPEAETIEINPNRDVMFTLNILSFLETNPPGLVTSINDLEFFDDIIRFDLDVTIYHPFPGIPQFDGYDVRGLFISPGTTSLKYNPSLIYFDLGVDPMLVNADGYSRWFNPSEFKVPGLFGYFQGQNASNSIYLTSTLNGYKYFADSLTSDDDVIGFLKNTQDRGVFSSGSSNARNYIIDFTTSTPGFRFGYAVLANWGGMTPEFHPSNANEALSCDAIISGGLYYTNEIENGGNIELDLGLFDWSSSPVSSVMEDYNIFIDSTVLSTPYEFSPSEMVPYDEDGGFYYYKVTIPADNITGVEGNDLWVCVEYPDSDYKIENGPPNDAGSDPLAAFFRYGLEVSDTPVYFIDVTYPNGGEMLGIGTSSELTWDSVGVDGEVRIEYSKDNFVSEVIPVSMNETNDGSYMWDSIPDDPTSTARVRITSITDPLITDISDGDFSIVDETGWVRISGGEFSDGGQAAACDSNGNVYVTGWQAPVGSHSDVFLRKYDRTGAMIFEHTWGSTYPDYGRDVFVDSIGNVYVVGEFIGIVDFDPGSGTENHGSFNNTNEDAFLSKFDSDGNFQWAKTFGGASIDVLRSVDVDNAGDIYIGGYYRGSVDFDPGSGEAPKISNGIEDAFFSKFDSDGNFIWVKTWGGSDADLVDSLAVDSQNNIWIAGSFVSTVDFDPGPPNIEHTSNGIYDCYLSKFDPDGNFIFVKPWGSTETDSAIDVEISSGNLAMVTGWFKESVDFDPSAGEEILTSAGGLDVFLTVFDSSGDFQWVKVFGGAGNDYGRGISIDLTDNAYISGYFWGTVDFDPDGGIEERTSLGLADSYVCKFDSVGTFSWVRSWGNSLTDNAWGICTDSAGAVYAVGYFMGDVEFAPIDPPCNNASDIQSATGFADIFLTRHRSNGCW